MRASVVTRCEVYMSDEEQKMLLRVLKWIEENTENEDEDLDLPEGIVEILDNIYDEISHLLDLIPDEH